MGYAVMTEEYRYTEWVSLTDFGLEEQTPNWGDPQDWGELYDMVNDPVESVNLFHSEDDQDTIDELKQALHKGWHSHN